MNENGYVLTELQSGLHKKMVSITAAMGKDKLLFGNGPSHSTTTLWSCLLSSTDFYSALATVK